MSSSNFCLTNFVRTIPVCSTETKVDSLVTTLLSSKQQFVAILDCRDRLVGIISERSVLLCLQANHEEQRDLQKSFRSLSAIDLSIELPIVLPVDTEVREFLTHLQAEASDRGSNPLYALVDRAEKFLGLLDTRSLLKSLALHNKDRSSLPNSTKIETCWLELIEQIPLPLSIQTLMGKIVGKNHCWIEQIERTDNNESSSEKIHRIPKTQKSLRKDDASYSEVANKSLPSQMNCPNNSYYWAARHLAKQGSGNSFINAPCSLENSDAVAFCGETVLRTTSGFETNLESLMVEQLKPELSIPAELTNPKSAEVSQTSWGHIATKTNNWQLLGLSLKIIEQYLSKSEIFKSDLFKNQFSDRQSESNSPFWLVLAIPVNRSQSEQELAAKNADLVELNRLKDEFLATLSHDLRSPLTALVGLSSLLKEQKLGQLNQRQSRYTELIYHSARQLMDLVNDLLDLARLEAGQLELTLKPLEIKDACEHAYAKTLENLVKKKQQLTPDFRPKFTLTIEPGLKTFVADELRLCQMLVHLLDNAHKFTPADGEIGIVVNRWANWIAITVWDSGSGISEESQRSLLRQFSKQENPWARSSEGKGLGLILVQQLAKAHGGDLSFISKVGRGSEFTILLPFVSRETGKEVNKGTERYLLPLTGIVSNSFKEDYSLDKSNLSALETNALSSCKLSDGNGIVNERSNYCSIARYAKQIFNSSASDAQENRLVLLVVENVCYIEMLTVKLSKLGYHAVVARTVTQALNMARQLQPAKILLNPSVSMLSGWDVLTSLKSDRQLKEISVFVIARESERQKSQKYGANGFLALPLAQEALTKYFPGMERSPNGDRSRIKILR
ncbi:MAG: ATP-binding protein, partial [Xenococcaceae cyanobacterium]